MKSMPDKLRKAREVKFSVVHSYINCLILFLLLQDAEARKPKKDIFYMFKRVAELSGKKRR